jgi:NADH dehydrogenase
MKQKNVRLVIVGGGFAGLKLALKLGNDERFKITLINDRDHFLFYPALYSTATGRSRQQSVIPISQVLQGTNVTFVQDTVTGIDANRKIAIGRTKQYHYDKVVFALGVVTSYFGIAGLDEYSYSIKSSHEIERFRRHLHDQLTSTQQLDKNYIVVGAGPTGVELAALLSQYIETVARQHGVSHGRAHVSLVEAAPRVLPRLSERSSELVHRRLRSVNVRIMTNKRVESEDDDSIIISGRDIPSRSVIWTSGVANHPFYREHDNVFTLAKNGRVTVDNNLRAAPDIYVIGDNADTPYVGLAQTAMYDALFVAKSLRAEIAGNRLPRYRPRRQPIVIPVGENWALLEYGPIRVTGIAGMVIHKAAAFIGYKDYFSLPKALSLWISETAHDEVCPVCGR